MSSEKKAGWQIWLIPIAAILLTVAFFMLTRLMVGPETRQEADYFQTPFVPGESPHSAVGPDSR